MQRLRFEVFFKLTANISDALGTIVGKHPPVSEAAVEINLRVLEQGVPPQRLFVLDSDNAPQDFPASRK